MTFTKCISGNVYNTGGYTQRALPGGNAQTSLGSDKGPPKLGRKAFLPFGDSRRLVLTPGVSRVLTSTASSANTALTVGIKSITIYVRTSDVYIKVGSGSQTASATSMFLAAGERRDIDLSKFDSPNIAIIYGPSTAAATLQITELS